jgi:hypothetical protein
VKGLRKRIELLTEYRGLPGTPDEVEIIMNRNDPDKSMLQADLFTKYSGHISEKTLIENFADFVPDAEAEIEQLKAEKQDAVETFMQGSPQNGQDNQQQDQQPANQQQQENMNAENSAAGR